MEFLTEYSYLRGRPDIIAMHNANELFSFEAKLKRWRVALHQAYRNTCFAHRSFVLLPEDVALRVMVYEREFARRAVGLCTVIRGEVRVLIPAPVVSPIQPALTAQIALAFQEER